MLLTKRSPAETTPSRSKSCPTGGSGRWVLTVGSACADGGEDGVKGPETDLVARIVAVGIPGAGPCHGRGDLLARWPHLRQPAFKASTEPSKVLEPKQDPRR